MTRGVEHKQQRPFANFLEGDYFCDGAGSQWGGAEVTLPYALEDR